MTPLAQVQALVPTAAPLTGGPSARSGALRPIQPLRSWPSGIYHDELVVVTACQSGTLAGSPAGRQADDPPGDLAVWRQADGRIAVRHRLRSCYPNDELASPLATALAPLTDDHEVFKRAFTGIVLTSRGRAEQAWDLFYRNSLDLIRQPGDPGYTAIYRHAAGLLAGAGAGASVADLGCGFGLFALYLADRGTAVTACDNEPGAAGLLRRAAGQLARRSNDPAAEKSERPWRPGRLEVLGCDARAVPRPGGSVDGVAMLHVLEHVDELTAAQLLREAMRLARHRVVVAVPYEPQPNSLFGHVRSIGAGQLDELGAATGWRYQVYEHHGGWLVLDRPFTSLPPSAGTQKLFLLSWLIVIVLLTLVSLRLPVIFTLLFVLVDLALLFVLLGTSGASTGEVKTGGYLVFAFCVVGAYLFADAYGAATGGKALPLGQAILTS